MPKLSAFTAMKAQMLIVGGIATSTLAAKFSIPVQKQEVFSSTFGLSSLFRHTGGNLNQPNEKQKVLQHPIQNPGSQGDGYTEVHGLPVGVSRSLF